MGSCGKTLNTSSLNEHNTQLYCKSCYEGLFDAHDYTIAQYGGIVTPEDIKRREEEERKRLEKLERQKNERRCPGCDMKAFPEDSVKLSDLYYHRTSVIGSLRCRRKKPSPPPSLAKYLIVQTFLLCFSIQHKVWQPLITTSELH